MVLILLLKLGMENLHDEVHISLYWSVFYILDHRWLVIRDQSLCDTINWLFYFISFKINREKNLKIKLDR